MPTIPNSQTIERGVPQHGTFWCIPASIENMLRCIGIATTTQEDLVEAYLRRHGVAQSIERHALLERFRCQPLPGANFGSFKDVAEGLLAEELGQRRFAHENHPQTEEYVAAIKQRIDIGEPVLISAQSGHGLSHITVVFGYEENVLWTFDPGLGRRENLDASAYRFQADLLTFTQ